MSISWRNFAQPQSQVLFPLFDSKNIVFWLDNFAKVLTHTFVKALQKSASFSSNLWTAFACRPLILPGNLLHLLSLIFKEQLGDLTKQRAFGYPNFSKFFHDHFLPGLNKALPDCVAFFRISRTCAEETHRSNFLKDFYPIDILDWNISSNDGLRKSFAKLFAYNEASFLQKRIILKVTKQKLRMNLKFRWTKTFITGHGLIVTQIRCNKSLKEYFLCQAGGTPTK